MEIGREMEPYHPNNEIRYAMYREMSRRLFGSLRRNNRREFPMCVTGEIKDAYPKKKDEAYVGFQPFGRSMTPVGMRGDTVDGDEESDVH
jgi:hypothetical protein